VDGFYDMDCDVPLKVAKVKERFIKTDKEQTFFVITTKGSLGALKLRKLGHQRWKIENNIFRAFNQQMKTKRVYTNNQNVFESLYLILMIAFNALKCFYQKQQSKLKTLYPNVKLTVFLLMDELHMSLLLPKDFEDT